MLLGKTKMNKLMLSIFSFITLLASCTNAPPAPVTHYPSMDKVALGDPFMPRMQYFLNGKLPEQTQLGQPLMPVTNNTMK
jgi:hypothetical protein